jgi:hypothetical protein
VLVARNLEQVQVNKRTSRLKLFAGILLFLVGAPISFLNVAFLLVAYTLVIIGFILFQSGLQGVAKWGRKIRNDQLVDQELRRLSDRYTLIHYPRIGGRTLDHVLVHETGLLVMTTKETIGRVEVRGTKYRKPGQSMFGRFLGMGGPQLGQPPTENGLDRKALLESLAAAAAERGWPTDVPVDGLIVFIAPRLVLSADAEADPPAVKLTDLLGWVQSHTRGMPIVLPTEARQEIADFVIATGGAVDEGHIDPRGAVEVEAMPASRRAARSAARPTTPQQVINARTERERLARRRTPATEKEAAPSGKGRRRNAPPEPTEEARDLSPLVPASGMAKVKRRERQSR